MNTCSDHYTPAACAAANCSNAYRAAITAPSPERKPLGEILAQRETPEPRGLARLDHSALLELRAIILTVIDDGDLSTVDDGDRGTVWDLYEREGAESFVTTEEANEQRLRFYDAIQAAIVARTAPAVTALQESLATPSSTPRPERKYACMNPNCIDGKVSVGCAIDKPLITTNCPECNPPKRDWLSNRDHISRVEQPQNELEKFTSCPECLATYNNPVEYCSDCNYHLNEVNQRDRQSWQSEAIKRAARKVIASLTPARYDVAVEALYTDGNRAKIERGKKVLAEVAAIIQGELKGE